MLGQREMTMEDVTGILRRRWLFLVVPIVVGPLIAMAIAVLLPAKYTSSSLIMIEQQRVPDSVVKSVVSENLIARLATMQEQVLSRNTLQPIIEKYGLYKSEVARGVSMDDLILELRTNLTVTPVPSILALAPSAKGVTVTLSKEDTIPGFYIAFTIDNPKMAQEVCADLTGQFIQQNLLSRSKMAHETTAFVDTQLVDAKRKLDEQDGKLAEFQKKFSGSLPDEASQNLSLLSAVTARLQAVTQSLGRAEQDKTYTESLLAQQLSAWDAVKARGGSRAETADKELAQLEERLSALEARYTPDHPDVIKLKLAIEQIKKSRASSSGQAGSAPDTADASPSFEPKEIQQLRSSLRGLDQAIGAYKQDQQRLSQEAKALEARLQMSPLVETQYKQLTRDSKAAQDFYNDLLSKKNNSSMATDLESGQEGEQFVILDSASLPDEPSFPIYWMFAAGGAGGGLGLGMAIVLLLELKDKAIRTERDIEFFLELPTLVLLPSVGLAVKQKNGRFRNWWRRRKPVVKHAAGQPA